MSSESDNPNTESDSPNTGVLVTIVAVGALAMIGISLAVTALVRYEVDANQAEKGALANVRPLREARADWEKKLNAPPAWVKPGQSVSLPIDRAMELVVADIQKNPALATRAKPAGSAGQAGDGAPTGQAADAGAAQPKAPGAAPAPEKTTAPGGGPTPASPAGASGGKTPPTGAVPAPKPRAPAPPAPAPKPTPQGNAP